jgi:hypothetical protein
MKGIDLPGFAEVHRMAALTAALAVCFALPTVAAPIVRQPLANHTHTNLYPADSKQGLKDEELKTLAQLEKNYFQRTFDDDLPEKRIKRLELFLNGYGLEGSLSQRLIVLKNAAPAKESGAKPAPTKHGAAQSVTQLELSILKKSYPALDLNSRLTTLEKKVFATSFASIPMAQRIARLQKTIGLQDDAIADAPGGSAPDFLGSQGFQLRTLPPGMSFDSPFSMMPYGNGGDDPDLNRHMGELFDHLNRQLRSLQSVPPGAFRMPRNQMPQMPKVQPNGSFDFSDGLPPDESTPQARPSLPPYMDPNSI